MTTDPLILDRRLAIYLLHEAQLAGPTAIRGVVRCDAAGKPERYVPESAAATLPQASQWAWIYSNPSAPAVPTPDEMHPSLLTLVISLNTKGVLELRAWRLSQGALVEQAVSIRD